MSAGLTDLSPLWLSLRSSALAVLLVVPLGFFAARQVSRWQGSRRAGADLLLLSPLVLPPTVLGFLLLQLLGPYGVVGAVLGRLGVELVFHWPAIVLSSAVVAFPLLYRTLLAAFDQMDPSLEAVALSLGAGPWRVLRTITLPLVMPGLLAGISLAYARALGEFGTTLMLAGNIPGRTQTLPLAIYAAVDGGDRALAWFWTVLVLILNGFCLLLVQGFQSRRLRRSPRPWSREEPAAPVAAGVARRPAPFLLEVDLEHHRPGFQLQLRFSSSCPRLAILGASGAGKSLLLRCLAGLERPDRGRIRLNGRLLLESETHLDAPLQRRRIAMVVQHHALFPHLSVEQNVAFGLAGLERHHRQTRLRTQLEAMGLTAFAGRFPHQLSGGQQQRVALARALVIEPELLLLDEPLSSQDAYRRRQLQQQMIEQLQRTGVPFLLVTHDIDEAYRMADDLLVINDGRLIAHGPRQQVFEQPGSLAAARLTGCKNITRIERRSSGDLWAPAWGVELRRQRPWDSGTTHVGLRANHLELHASRDPVEPREANAWPCRVVDVNESALSVSVYVRPLGDAPAAGEALQVEMAAGAWRRLAAGAGPLILSIPDSCLMPLR
ncbi:MULTISPECIES: molybdate ABC transporter permease subunit [unclassified Synechococcus]|uniref:molybdate ABC transporter permease subunit n=1 Tax=unclassified Synechococcus TaxID=2626047 RepID=UPI0000698608|nr:MULTISPECIES: molybdate ABC transporter permease subunit [unclassified Synechococcus]EAQ75542.1 Molybdate ABC transporter, permease protein [Synechococcus sp. WH 5701]WFN59765.1 molybdate ABC transporter permease subunit [Synechococcus sp. CCFWC 502]